MTGKSCLLGGVFLESIVPVDVSWDPVGPGPPSVLDPGRREVSALDCWTAVGWARA